MHSMEIQQKLNFLADGAGRRQPNNNTRLTTVALCAFSVVLGAMIAHVVDRRTLPDLTRSVDRLTVIAAATRNVDALGASAQLEQFVGKPLRNFSTPDQMQAINYLLEHTNLAACSGPNFGTEL